MAMDPFCDEAEKAAVMAVVEAETEAYYNKDFEAFSSCWVHAPFIRRLGWWKRGGVADRWGWEAIGGHAHQQMLDNPDPQAEQQAVRRENLVVRVSGDMAWVTFDQYADEAGEPDMDMPGLSRETRILERHEGAWRIVYHTYIHSGPETERAAMLRIGEDGHLSWMNNSAREFIARGEGLRVRAGRVQAMGSGVNDKLQAAIAKAAQASDKLDGRRIAVPIILDVGYPEEVCVCWVLNESTVGGAVLLSINDPLLAQDTIDAAAEAFSLSISQKRLAELIVAGKDLVRSSALLGVSVTTARTQLQRMFEKTGARSQPALVKAILACAPPG